IQGIHGSRGLEMKIARKINPLQHEPEECCDVVNIGRVVVTCRYEKILGQRKLPLPQYGVCLSQEFHRLAIRRVRQIPFAPDRQKQRMNTGRIDRMNPFHSRQYGRDQLAGEFVYEGAERSVLLRRTTYGGKRPDRVVPVIYLLHPEYREVVSKAVVAEMVAERPFRQQLFR